MRAGGGGSRRRWRAGSRLAAVARRVGGQNSGRSPAGSPRGGGRRYRWIFPCLKRGEIGTMQVQYEYLRLQLSIGTATDSYPLNLIECKDNYPVNFKFRIYLLASG